MAYDFLSVYSPELVLQEMWEFEGILLPFFFSCFRDFCLFVLSWDFQIFWLSALFFGSEPQCYLWPPGNVNISRERKPVASHHYVTLAMVVNSVTRMEPNVNWISRISRNLDIWISRNNSWTALNQNRGLWFYWRQLSHPYICLATQATISWWCGQQWQSSNLPLDLSLLLQDHIPENYSSQAWPVTAEHRPQDLPGLNLGLCLSHLLLRPKNQCPKFREEERFIIAHRL